MNTPSSNILCLSSESVVLSGNNDIPKVPSPAIPVTVAGGSPQSVTSSPATTDLVVEVAHKEWAEKAFDALVLSFMRYPSHRPDFDKARREFVETYAKRAAGNTAMKWLKFHTSYLFAKSMCQTELPLAPDGIVVPSVEEKLRRKECAELHKSYQRPADLREDDGCFCKGLFSYLCSTVMVRSMGGSWPFRRCAYDILMSKIGDPVAPDSFVEQTFRDHQAALTHVAPCESESKENTLYEVEAKIKEICHKVFRRVVMNHNDWIPSMRACFENSIKDGGGLGELIKGWNATESATTLLSLAREPELMGMVEVKPGVVKELRFVIGEDCTTDFQNYVDRLWRSRIDTPLEAIPVPILEPLKVRMITKGQAAEYYRCIELQKLMHGALRRQKPFEYIGHPIDDQSWYECFGSKEDLPEGYFYVSGDYKAATDNLDPSLSEYAWRCICSEVTIGNEKLAFTPYLDLGLKALTRHRLHYPEIKDLTPEVAQSWGQLMGSPMSFPILCIVNMAATLVALGQSYSKNLKIKVNGDDIGFIANDEQYLKWKDVTALAGLQFSVGKNYTSREFLIMNSELRRPPKAKQEVSFVDDEFLTENIASGKMERLQHEVSRPKPWKLEGFLNQSLLTGTVKKGQDAGEKKVMFWTDLESTSTELLRGIPAKSQWALLGRFLKIHAPVFAKAPRLANSWFPKRLGGIGIALPANMSLTEMCEKEVRDGHLTEEMLEKQRKLAGYLTCNTKARLSRPTLGRPLVGVIGQVMKEARALSDAQVPAVLRSKPLRREQVQMVGGTVLLYQLLIVAAMAGNDVPLGGDQCLEGAAVWALERRLYRSYMKWTEPSIGCSLSPMGLENINMYKEHLEMRSMIEVVSVHSGNRELDFW